MAETPEKPVPLNLRIPSSLKRRFHLWAVSNGTTMTAELIAHIEAVVSKAPKPQKPR